MMVVRCLLVTLDERKIQEEEVVEERIEGETCLFGKF